ncbi:MAG: carboxypeptidase-like regulatory domain-containing protein [Tepidisphaeraceae bacterium]
MKTPFWLILVFALLSPAALAADLTGRVVSPDGKPVKDATVYVFKNSHSLAADLGAHRDAPTTRCDDSGNFHFPATNPNGGQFIATAPGFGLGGAMIDPNHPTRIHLSRPSDVTLTFLTIDKKPVAGVVVSFQSAYFPQTTSGLSTNIWIPSGYNSPWSATTDANGVCTIPGLPQGAQVEFAVADERYAELSYRDRVVVDTAAKTRADPIHLLPACTISGVVTYATTGKPAAGIAVAAESSETGDTEAVTAADGSYTVKQLRPGQYEVAIFPDDELLKSWTAKAVGNIALGAGSAKSAINLSLIPGVILTGTTVAADDRNPIAGVPIGICGPAYPRSTSVFVQSVRTDANGTFTARVPPGDQFVYVESNSPADGFGRPSPDSKTVTIPDGQTASVEFRLPRVLIAPVKGKVVDPDGNPVAGAMVMIFGSPNDAPMLQHMATTTGGDGTFQTVPMPRTGQFQLRARFQDLATSKALLVNRASPGDVVIQLEKNALATVSGRVLDPQGQPIKGAQIELVIRTGRFASGENSGSTDEQGNYTIGALWADAVYSVNTTRDGYGQADTSDLRLQPGQTTRAHDLTLYKRDSSVAGVLLDADSKPVAGTQINLNGPRTGYSGVTTDSNGQFSCAVVSGDRLNLSFYTRSGYRSRIAGAGDQKIVLRTAPPKRAATPPAPAAPAAEVASSPPPPPLVFDPAAAVTWQGWLWAAVLVVAGGIIAIIANAIAAFRASRRACPKIRA